MINNITERNEQQYLLLSTTYPLNSSHMNKLHMGLQSTKEGTLEPIVKLTGNYRRRNQLRMSGNNFKRIWDS